MVCMFKLISIWAKSVQLTAAVRWLCERNPRRVQEKRTRISLPRRHVTACLPVRRTCDLHTLTLEDPWDSSWEMRVSSNLESRHHPVVVVLVLVDPDHDCWLRTMTPNQERQQTKRMHSLTKEKQPINQKHLNESTRSNQKDMVLFWLFGWSWTGSSRDGLRDIQCLRSVFNVTSVTIPKCTEVNCEKNPRFYTLKQAGKTFW